MRHQHETTLKSLDLGDNQIGDEGGVAIAKALSVNTTLTDLNLMWNQIGDEGGIAIGEALKVNTTLTTLSLQTNALGREGKDALRRAAMPMAKLRTAVGIRPLSVHVTATECWWRGVW